MVLFDPVQGVAYKKILHLIFSIVKDLGAPVRVFSLPGVRVLIERLAVKICQAMGVLRKMGRYPVKNHADPVAVEIVYKVHKFFGRAVPGCGGKISRDLIAP